ncbi:galactosylceramide sulfotransferase-like [Antedon mediterranea]|uniref:galactosylceramide sulfotransferase-like n=1 Tax=Antedon mediterranea TaxID=105859 RepID=UPI003AF71478
MASLGRNRRWLIVCGISILLLVVYFKTEAEIKEDMRSDDEKNDRKKYVIKIEGKKLMNITREKATSSSSINKENKMYTAKQYEVCIPKQQILFLKTHKTGSSTLTSILQVYGFLRNLTFAVPKTGAQIISRGFFRTDQVRPGKYDMLVNHARYSRTEMQKVMKPNTTYITIFRDPSTQIESNFEYFLLRNTFHLENMPNPFQTFAENPSYYYSKYGQRSPFRHYMKNPNLYDLGLKESQQEDRGVVEKFIAKIAKEFDLVLIQEYFNESLLLLKKLMCWEIDDILYLSKGKRSKKIRFDIDQSLRESIRKWSWGDVLLYDHFNKTLWSKIRDYGPSFQTDLAELEFNLNRILNNCTVPNVVLDNRRETYFKLNKKGAPKCTHMLRNDLTFTKLIRIAQYGEEEETGKVGLQ